MIEIKCPECGRKNFRFLIRKKKYHCTPCGCEWEIIEEELEHE